ncbi:hypothetical protein C1646_470680 [Rhizophagus diaphanus]|nr:hypothetical protein C1646_470680 [Rhizophagus diaphanus] [Rhizophagus sp. MUCL 43196]
MGLPMYVSPSISKRQLPSKQPTSPPYTPQAEESFDETFQNARTSVFDIPESQTESQRSQRSRRSSSLPYTLVQQHIHRLHQLHQLHRTREQQHISTNLASRRGLNSAHHLSLNHRTQIQQLQQMQAVAQARRESNFDNSRNFREERSDDSHDEMFDLSFDDLVSSLDNNNYNIGDIQRNNDDNNNNTNSNSSSNSSNNNSSSNNNNINNNNNNNDNYNSNNSHHHHHRSSSSSSSPNVALDNVIRRVNLLRQISQQQEMRSMRSSSRHHRSSTGHSSGRSSRMTSQNTNVDRRRDDLIQRGIDMPSSRHHQIPDSNLLYEHSVPFPPMQRLSAWHTRRGVNWSAVDPPPVQRTERRSSFTDDFYSTSEIPNQYDSDDHHLSRIISPIPRRYDSRFPASIPIGNDHGLLLESDNNNNSNNRTSSNDSIGTEPRGSASGEVC